jgi:sugar phosphate permease
MQCGAVVLGLALVATSFVQAQWQWLLVNGLAVTAGAALIGNLVVNVTLSKWFVEKRGRVVGFSSMGVSFAGVFLVPATTTLVDVVGWRTAWQVLGVAIFLVIFPVSFLMRRAPEDYGLHPDGKSAAEIARGGGQAAAADFASSMTRSQALRTPSFYLIVFAYGFGALSIGVMLAQTVPYMTDAGYSRTFAAFMISLTSIPAMFTKPLWGWLVDKIDARALSATGFLINAVAMVAIVLSVRSGSEPAVLASYFLLGFGWGGLIPLQEVVWASFFGRRYLGSVRSAGLPFSLIVGASAPYVTTLYFDRIGNYDGAFLAIAGFAILATLLILSARKPSRAPVPTPALSAA